MKCGVLLAAGVLVLLASVARADIFEWRDVDGTRHFTNDKAKVPAAEEIQVVVTEPAASSKVATAAAAAPEPEPERETPVVVYDDSRVRDAYVDGLQQGLALAARGGDTLQVTGPLVVVDVNGGWASAPPPYSYPAYYDYPTYYYPLVATSFDRGARYRTLRRRFGGQSRLHRHGSFVQERFPTAFGPSLNPIPPPLQLPHGLSRGARGLF